MAITWAQALDYDKVTIVPHNGSYTRALIEKSGYFAVQIPTAAQAELVSELGAENNSRFDNAFASVSPSLTTSSATIFSSVRSSRHMRASEYLTADTGCLKRSLTS